MTKYLSKMNRQARLHRLGERMFEIFISNIDGFLTIAALAMLAAMIIGGLVGLADLACSPPRYRF